MDGEDMMLGAEHVAGSRGRELDLGLFRPEGGRIITFIDTPPPIRHFLHDIQSQNRLLRPVTKREPVMVSYVNVLDKVDGKLKQLRLLKSAMDKLIELARRKPKIVKGKVSKSTKRKHRQNRQVNERVSGIKVRLIDPMYGAYLVSYPKHWGITGHTPYTHIECTGAKAAIKHAARRINEIHRGLGADRTARLIVEELEDHTPEELAGAKVTIVAEQKPN